MQWRFNPRPLSLKSSILPLSSIICLYTLEVYISNNMDPDQTAPKEQFDQDS